MKSSAFLIFFTIVLTLYAAINYYIIRRGWQGLAGTGIYQTLFLILLFFLVLAYPAGRFAERMNRNGVSEFLIYVGSFYLGIMIYAFFLIVLLDILRLGNHFFHFLPSSISHNPHKSAQAATLGIALLSIFLIIIGHLNALHPRLRTLNLHIDKPGYKIKKLNMVVASDIHLGTLINNSRLIKLVETINKLEPDLVLFPGDVVDEDIGALVHQNMAETLQKIRSRYGVFAVTGNHEYIGGVREAIRYMKKGHIEVLQDTVVKIADSFYLAGRKDLMANRFGEGRKSLPEIIQGVDGSYPLILMDHQPFRLESARENGVDLQLSGHTHHGQLFPFNLVTKMIYEISWGYERRGSTQYYVSCGAGTWGPPVRLGSTPEIANIQLTFGKE